MDTGTRIRTIADWAVIALFLAATGLPLAGAFLPDPHNQAANDLRPLASLPPLRPKRSVLIAFPTQFEKYWEDHFGFRGPLIYLLNVVKVRGLHASTAANVLLGRPSWLFYTHLPAGMDYNAVRPFTADELDHWRRVLERRRDWLQRRGCKYVLFIPPDKQTIYPEYLDPVYRSRHDQSRLDQLLAHLRSCGSSVEVLDIRQPMRAAKERERLYHQTDSHWNDHGAFLGYEHLTGVLARWFPAVRPVPRSGFVEETAEKRGGDLATMVYLAERLPEQMLNLVPRSPRRWRPSAQGVVARRGRPPPFTRPPPPNATTPTCPAPSSFTTRSPWPCDRSCPSTSAVPPTSGTTPSTRMSSNANVPTSSFRRCWSANWGL